MEILIINGPNLNLVGRREPEIYGDESLQDYMERELLPAAEGRARLTMTQSNSEGQLVDILQRAGYDGKTDAVVLNAGAYTHYSLAIADAIRAIPVPVIEVHISNIYAREEMRRHSVISPCCAGVIAGFGLDSYRYGVEAAIRIVEAKKRGR